MENHADGTPHLHAIVMYPRRINVQSAKYFDFSTFHGNVARLIDAESADKYTSKDDTEPLVHGSYTPRKKNSKDKGPTRDEIMYELYETSNDKDEFLSKVRNAMAYTYFTNYDRLASAASSVFKTPLYTYKEEFPGHPWILPREIKDWLRDEFDKPQRAKALCVIGESRFAKTTWARSLGRHIFWRQSTNLDTWDPDAKYIIIDDIDWKFLPNKKCWLTAMGDMTVTDRYRSKRDITNYKPCIYLCNEDQDPRLHMDSGESSYWSINMVFVTLKRTLINENHNKMLALQNSSLVAVPAHENAEP